MFASYQLLGRPGRPYALVGGLKGRGPYKHTPRHLCWVHKWIPRQTGPSQLFPNLEGEAEKAHLLHAVDR